MGENIFFFKSQKTRRQKRDMASTQETSSPPSSYERKTPKVSRNISRFYTILVRTRDGSEIHLVDEELIARVSFTEKIIIDMCEAYKKADESPTEQARKEILCENYTPFSVYTELYDNRSFLIKSYIKSVLFGDPVHPTHNSYEALKDLAERENPTLTTIITCPHFYFNPSPSGASKYAILSNETKAKYDEMRNKPYVNLGTCLEVYTSGEYEFLQKKAQKRDKGMKKHNVQSSAIWAGLPMWTAPPRWRVLLTNQESTFHDSDDSDVSRPYITAHYNMYAPPIDRPSPCAPISSILRPPPELIPSPPSPRRQQQNKK